jgi:hypothetical protein
MTERTRKWVKGIIAAFVGGGASAITSGITGMGFAPDKFNLSDLKGTGSLLGLMAANFLVSGILSVTFYLRQSPVPPDSTGNTEMFSKPTPTEPKL